MSESLGGAAGCSAACRGGACSTSGTHNLRWQPPRQGNIAGRLPPPPSALTATPAARQAAAVLAATTLPASLRAQPASGPTAGAAGRGLEQRCAAQAAPSAGGERQSYEVGELDDVYYYERAVDEDEEALERDPLDTEIEVEEEDGSVRSTSIGALTREYVDWCNDNLSLSPFVEVHQGRQGLPYVQLRHPNGSTVQVYLHGACVTSWRKPGGAEVLHVLPGNKWDGQAPIAGGIPVIFPQYRRGPLPANGFLSRVHWSLADAYVGPPTVEDIAPAVTLAAESDDSTRELWPYEFEALYTVRLGLEDDPDEVEVDPEQMQAEAMAAEAEAEAAAVDRDGTVQLEPEPEDEDRSAPPLQLSCTLQIRNTDTRPFEFSAALASHFAASLGGDSRALVRTLGLGGKYMLDWGVDATGSQPVLRVEDQDYITFGGPDRIDRLYVDVDADKGDILFCPGNRTHLRLINRSGFRDIGAWHPQRTPRGDRGQFVSLPCARAARPVTLYPGEVWTGEMVLRAYDYYWEQPIFERGMQPMPPRRSRR